jgi:hypothetical protein
MRPKDRISADVRNQMKVDLLRAVRKTGLLPAWRTSICLAFVLLFVTSLLLAQAAPETQAVAVISNRNTTYLSRATLSGLPHVTVRSSVGGEASWYEGVPLSSLLSHAGIEIGHGLTAPQLLRFLLAEAADGRQVIFSFAEIDPTFSDNNIILADRQNGKDITVRDWPRIISPKDKRMDRWLTQVSKFQIVVAHP